MKQFLKNQFNKDINNIYFIGIGGSSMSGLAKMAKDSGFEVSGSDMNESGYTANLAQRDISVNIGQKAENIGEDIDLVVYTAAINETNPEMVKADQLGIPKLERSKFLGLISDYFNLTIGVAGTHGKTTTSSLISLILHEADFEPSFSIGGSLDEIGGNAKIDSKEYFVVESCEFRDSFLETNHDIGIITNIEEDHLDYFKGGLEQIKESFHKFAEIIPENGLLVAWGDEDEVHEVCTGLKCPVVYYGIDSDNDWIVKDITYNSTGEPTFILFNGDQEYGSFKLKVPGEHNVLNATAAIIVADYLGISKETIQKSFDKFTGAHRRFEFRGEVNGINVYEDYAHHPTELKVVIESALNHDHNKLWVVFQPHTYSRTRYLLDEFIDAFEKADKVILNDIYSDREDNLWDIYSEDIAKKVKEKYNKPTVVLSEFDDIVKFLTDNLEEDDLVLVAGSQTINKVAFKLVDALKEKYPENI